MSNIFPQIEDYIFSNEEIMFDENKIKTYVTNTLISKLKSSPEKQRHFLFEKIIYDFFRYINIPIITTKKTRDFGIDGVIKLNLELLGNIDLGLQIKHKLIDSTDVDLFLSALKNSELQLGLIVCKDSRNLKKYELNSKIKAILLSKGIKIKERIIQQNININPVFILKMDEIIEITTHKIRGVIQMVYKK